MNKRKKKLKEIKRERILRDELIKCDNIGRQKYLLGCMSMVWCVDVLKRNNTLQYVEILTYDRYSYGKLGINAFHELGNEAYKLWLEKILN